MRIKKSLVILAMSLLAACGNDNIEEVTNIPTPELTASEILKLTITEASAGVGLSAFILPSSDDFDNIPQDLSNPITTENINQFAPK